MNPHLQISIPPLLLFCAIAGGCGGSEDSSATSQVAVKVNDTEITVHQINSVLARTPNVTPAVEHRVKREILDNLINQQLARQQAIENKLDRTPTVLQKLEATRTEVLARAYIEQITAAQPKATPEEIRDYYYGNPALFERRRVYSLEEISLQAQAGLADKLRERAVKARSLQEIAAWLKAEKIPFTANNGVRAAEQLPLAYLEKMQGLKDGENQVFEMGVGIQVVRVVASKPAPVSEAAAAPRIQQFLLSQSSNKAIAREMEKIKEQATIEYVGEFAVAAADADAKAKAQIDARAKTQAEAKAKAEAEAKQQAQARSQASIEARDRTDAIARARAESEQARRAAETAAPAPARKPLPAETLEKGVRGL